MVAYPSILENSTIQKKEGNMNKLIKPFLLLMLLVQVGWTVQVKADEKVVETMINEPIVQLELSEKPVILKLNEEFDPQSLVVKGSYDQLNLPVVKTDTIGDQVIVYKAINNYSSLSQVKVITVVDDQKPTFTKSTKSITIQEKSTVDFNKYFAVEDNYDKDLSIAYSGNYDVNKPGTYKLIASTQDSSANQTSVEFNLIVKAKPKPKPVVITTTAGTTIEAPSGGYKPKLTRYGADCRGCTIRNGVAYLASGVAVTTEAVKQPNGTWKDGITYGGRYIFASSSARAMCSLVSVYNHPYSGRGIQQGTPIQGIILDRGVSNPNHLDLFVGSERNLNAVRVVSSKTRATAIITGVGIRTANGCRF